MTRQHIQEWVRTKLWDQVPVSISVIDRNYHIVEANRCFTEFFGDWHTRPCYAVYKGRNERCENCAASKSFADGRIRVLQQKGRRREGRQTWYLVHMIPLVREDGQINHIIEMSTDITATKLLEHEKLEAERLAAVGQTVAGLAHGIKNLLMGLDGGMYMARTGIEHGNLERMLEGWEILEDNVARISSFVREFLEFARGKVPEVHSVDPNRPARQVIELFRDTAHLANTELRAELTEGLAPATMDAEGIHSCLANLISNALDACDTSDRASKHVTLRTFEENGAIVYEVSDDGTGMDYEVKQKVFTNFFSTKATGKGTGLGLLTTRRIVQEHGGKVSFESSEGQGSTFRLVFPRQRLPRPTGEDDENSDV